MRVIGNKIKKAYNEVITAIFILDIDKTTLSNIHISTKSRIGWINQKTRQYTYMIIQQMAKYLSISQLFAYNFINYQLMSYTLIGGINTR